MPELEARLQLRGLETKVKEYLSAVDAALETLSQGQEGTLARVPAWCLSHRELHLAVNRDGRGVLVKVVPREDLDSDRVFFQEIATMEELGTFMQPWTANFDPSHLSKQPFVMFGPMSVTSADDPLAAPQLLSRQLVGWGQLAGAEEIFVVDSGKKDAIEFWNGAVNGLRAGPSFIAQASAIFDRCQASIRLKAFRERKIHRLLRDHAIFLLPLFKRLFFEHELYLEGAMRKADFILEREFGLPSLLIELESPVHPVFRKDGHLTSEVTHARGQIAEWTWFIDRDPQRNAEGEMRFLAGPKQRLVIIGRGLEHREALLKESASTDTGVWTYDVLLEQARERWNGILEAQCRQVNRPVLRPF